MLKKEKMGGGGSLPSIPQPILSPQSKRQAFLVLRGVTERKAGTKKERKKVRARPKEGGKNKREESSKGEAGGRAT